MQDAKIIKAAVDLDINVRRQLQELQAQNHRRTSLYLAKDIDEIIPVNNVLEFSRLCISCGDEICIAADGPDCENMLAQAINIMRGCAWQLYKNLLFWPAGSFFIL